eukprot:c30479_g1_i1 orf=109-294(+)
MELAWHLRATIQSQSNWTRVSKMQNLLECTCQVGILCTTSGKLCECSYLHVEILISKIFSS